MEEKLAKYQRDEKLYNCSIHLGQDLEEPSSKIEALREKSRQKLSDQGEMKQKGPNENSSADMS